jgi:hypothetical protein
MFVLSCVFCTVKQILHSHSKHTIETQEDKCDTISICGLPKIDNKCILTGFVRIFRTNILRTSIYIQAHAVDSNIL